MDRKVSEALEYARAHRQAVRIGWLDRKASVCDALEAVALCSDRLVSGHIVGSAARDKRLEDMLNRLLDDE